jgi:flagellar biosynthesis/type III secretory pathway protein FliH
VSEFRSFASILSERAKPAQPAVASQPEARVEPPTPPPIRPREVEAPPVQGASPQIGAMLATFASEIVRLRARAAELVENEAESLLQMIASRVLVRELELAPADVTALVLRVREEWDSAHPLRFRVALADLERLGALGPTLEADPALQPGDLQVELGEGLLDLRLGTRLAAVLEAHRIDV